MKNILKKTFAAGYVRHLLLPAAALLLGVLIGVGGGSTARGATPASPAGEGYRLDFRTPQQLQQFLCAGAGLPAFVHAHRGGSYWGYPENCIETFNYTLSHTPAFMEVDPRMTADGVIVLMHDATLDRTTNASGPLKNKTLAELDAQVRLKDRFGNVTPYKVPTFEQALLWAKGRSALLVDHKDAPLDKVVAEIDRAGAQANVIVMAYNLEDGRQILALDPSLTLQVFVKDSASMDALVKSGIPLGNVVAFVGHTWPADPSVFALLHAHGIKAIVGTSRNVDRTEHNRGADAGQTYRDYIRGGADIIEADSAVVAGEALRPLWIASPNAAKYVGRR